MKRSTRLPSELQHCSKIQNEWGEEQPSPLLVLFNKANSFASSYTGILVHKSLYNVVY